jgi:predicted acyl esterase
MRWKDSDSYSKLITPYQIYQIKLTIQYYAYIINQGHKIRITITGSNYPKFSA